MAVWTISIYFAWLALQNVVAPYAYRSGLLSMQQTYALMATKDVILFASVLLLSQRIFRKKIPYSWIDLCALGYMAMLGLYLFVPDWLHLDVPFLVRLITYRAQIGLVMFYFWGRLCYLSWAQWRAIALVQVGLQTAAAIFGIYERFFLPLSFWSDTVGIGGYLIDVKQLDDLLNVQDGLPSNLFHFGLRRLISVYADPLGMGIACVFPLVAAVALAVCFHRNVDAASKNTARWYTVSAVLIGLALLLTIGRESIGAAVLAILVLFVALGQKQLIGKAAVAAICVSAIVPSLRNFAIDTITFKEATAATHLNMLSDGIRELPTLLMGRGLGTTGAWATSMGVRGLTSVAESSYLELSAQAGVVTLALFLAFLIGMARWLWLTARRSEDAVWQAMFFALSTALISRLAFAVFSPSFFALIPMANLFFLAGAAMTMVPRLAYEPESVIVEEVMEESGEVAYV